MCVCVCVCVHACMCGGWQGSVVVSVFNSQPKHSVLEPHRRARRSKMDTLVWTDGRRDGWRDSRVHVIDNHTE